MARTEQLTAKQQAIKEAFLKACVRPSGTKRRAALHAAALRAWRLRRASAEEAGRPFNEPEPQKPKPERTRRDVVNEIKFYQKQQKGLFLPKMPFMRVVREIMHGIQPTFVIHPMALAALQEAAEAVLVGAFEASNLLAKHAKRVTIQAKDMDLLRKVIATRG